MTDRTLNAQLEEISRKFPDKTAVIEYSPEGTKTFTFADLKRHTEEIACFISSNGLSGTNAAISLPNSFVWIKIFFGTLKSSSACVPVDSNLSAEEFAHILRHSGSKMLFCSRTVALKIQNLRDRLPYLKEVIITDGEANIPGTRSLGDIGSCTLTDTPLSGSSSGQNAVIIYTSGTTSNPKGVMLSHKNLMANFFSLRALGIYNETDNTLAVLPFHHTYSLMATVILPLFSGSTITITNSLRADAITAALKENKVTMFTGVPELFKGLLSGIQRQINAIPLGTRLFLNCAKEPLWAIKCLTGSNLARIFFKHLHLKFGGKIRFMVSGGAKLDARTAMGLMKLGFEIVEGYGLSETSPVVTMGIKTPFNLHSAGRPIQGVKIKVIKQAGSGEQKEAVPGETGEIIISGDNVMTGYYKNPDLTSEAVKEGWFYSGDLGYVDKNGWLCITGRSKDVIVLSSGKNIYPDEVEAYYKQSPYIKELCVIDLENASGDAQLYGVVIPDEAYFKKTGEVNVSATIKWEIENLSKKTPSYRRIMGFLITREDFPKTALGKIKRYLIKTRYPLSSFNSENSSKDIGNASASAERTGFKDGADKDIIEALEKELRREVNPNDNLELDLGLDSLSRINLGLALSCALKINIPEETVSKAYTVEELIKAIGNLSGGPDQKAPVCKEPLKWDRDLFIAPEKETLKSILVSRNILRTFISLLGLFLLKMFLGIFFFLKSKGRSNLPKNGPYIICPNHTSFLDGFIISASLPYRIALKTSFLGFNFKLYRMPVIRAIVRILGIIPINPAENLVESMRACAFLLKQERIICIFPEGKRGISKEPDEFKKGAAILATELNIPLIPTYIKGSLEAWPRKQALPKPYPVSVVFGEILAPETVKRAEDNKDNLYSDISARLRQRVIELSR